MRDLAAEIATTSFSRGLPHEAVSKLAEIAKDRFFPASHVLFAEGEIHRSVYLVLQGRLVLDIFVQGRGRVEFLTVSNGDFLGWSPLATSNPMSARATTLTNTRLAMFSADAVRSLCNADHTFGYYFMKQLIVAFGQRLTATRIQMLDVFASQQRLSNRQQPDSTAAKTT